MTHYGRNVSGPGEEALRDETLTRTSTSTPTLIPSLCPRSIPGECLKANCMLFSSIFITIPLGLANMAVILFGIAPKLRYYKIQDNIGVR